MNILVQKFGGTSVSSSERREMVVDKIEYAVKQGCFPIVVVSAIGRSGDPYATDTLINIARLNEDCPNPREMDLIMSCGEIISCVVLSNTLRHRGYNCVVLTGGQAGIYTDNNFGDAEILKVDTAKLCECIEKNLIPIIAGFQGITENNEITTLGRGGSDVTGSIIGEALNAQAVEIYTDVEGIMTADPKIVADAAVMDKIFYNEVFQMAEYGAKVIHPRAVEIAMRSNVPLYIKNTMSNSPGTLITSCDKNRNYRQDKSQKLITAIANIDNRSQVKVRFDGSVADKEKDDILFDLIANAGISIDMINIYPKTKVFIIENSLCDKLEALIKANGYKYEIIRNCSKVTIIGNKMRGIPGVMAKVVSALTKSNIQLIQTSDSHTTISCLLNSEYTNAAVNALHREFGLGKSNIL